MLVYVDTVEKHIQLHLWQCLAEHVSINDNRGMSSSIRTVYETYAHAYDWELEGRVLSAGELEVRVRGCTPTHQCCDSEPIVRSDRQSFVEAHAETQDNHDDGNDWEDNGGGIDLAGIDEGNLELV